MRVLRVLLWIAVAERRAILRGLAWIVAGVVVCTTALTALQCLFAPWAHSFFLWPTLAGSWYGELSPSGGRPHRMFLDIGGGADDGGTSIDGTGMMCDETGTIRRFDLFGRPSNWRGTRFTVTMRAAEDRDEPGLELGPIRGRWIGDTIDATAADVWYSLPGGHTANVAGDPLHFMLRRGRARDFTAACAAARASAAGG